MIDNLLHCLRHGCKLGWMVDPDDCSILLFAPQQEPDLCRGAPRSGSLRDRQLRVLEGVNLTLTAQQVFAWLKLVK